MPMGYLGLYRGIYYVAFPICFPSFFKILLMDGVKSIYIPSWRSIDILAFDVNEIGCGWSVFLRVPAVTVPFDCLLTTCWALSHHIAVLWVTYLNLQLIFVFYKIQNMIVCDFQTLKYYKVLVPVYILIIDYNMNKMDNWIYVT